MGPTLHATLDHTGFYPKRGQFRTTTLTAHTHTNAAVIERILGDRFSIEEAEAGWLVSVPSQS